MKSYVWLTFGFMGWAYYEISGGSDFVPVEREVAAVVEQVEAPDLVARADTTTLMTVSTSNISTPDIIAPTASSDDVTAAVLEAVALDTAEDVSPVLEASAQAEAPAPVVEDKLDIREVANSRVNMRIGPGTGFDVITTLDPGTKLEILEVDADGWANVSTLDRGIEGWMAERLLTTPET